MIKQIKKPIKSKLYKIGALACTFSLIEGLNPVNAMADDIKIKELPGNSYRIEMVYNDASYVTAVTKEEINNLLNSNEDVVIIDTDKELKISKEELENALKNATNSEPPLYLTIISGVVFIFIVGSGVYGVVCDRDKRKTLK